MVLPVRFGLNVDPNTGGLSIAQRITAIADAAGLELVGIQDHPYNAEFADTLTVITWLAGKTSQVHFFPNVANLPLRPPIPATCGWTISTPASSRPPIMDTGNRCSSRRRAWWG
jgi:alkanesulfonate monooxygenase SsuD/methylene tetrahydromethanopterin reductase-like flavin-dependent oxidoreductase (luciferase family)